MKNISVEKMNGIEILVRPVGEDWTKHMEEMMWSGDGCDNSWSGSCPNGKDK